MQFSLVGTVQTGFEALDYGVSDLVVRTDGAAATVYATSGKNGGLASYALTSTGTASLVDHVFYNPAWQTGLCSQISVVEDSNGAPHVLIGMTDSTTLGGYAISSAGEIGALANFAGLDAATVCPEAVYVTGSKEVLVAGKEAGFASYELLDTGLQAQSVMNDPTAVYAETISAFADVRVNGTWFTIAASGEANAISVFEQTATGPVLTDMSGPVEGVGLMRPTAVETVVVDGRTFVIVGSAMDANGALSVFHLDDQGALIATDHVLDSLATRFGGVQDLAVTTHNGVTFVVAGGGDDGLSLFILLPGGQLQHVVSMADTLEAGLSNVSALGAAVIDTTLRILVSSQSEGMLTDLGVDLADLGEQLVAPDTGGELTGTPGGDVLVGGAGADSLAGGAGDDIIVDGGASDTMTGGAGRDVFVLRADDSDDLITDFDPAFDSLDLSAWPMFRDRSGLEIVPTASGATVTWRGETLTLQGAGGTLDPDEVRARVIQAIDRPFDRSATALPDPGSTGTVWTGDGDDVVIGTAQMQTVYLEAGNDSFETTFGDIGAAGIFVDGGDGNDTITAAAANDEIFGGTGLDVITGGDGDDILNGGAGDDELIGDAGDDVISGGDGNDTVSAGEGNDVIYGGLGDDNLKGHRSDDTIFGGDGHDRLVGGSGNDTLHGEAGKDQLTGGSGDDLLDGGVKPDKLKGEDGADTLHGGDGNDKLVGGLGADVLHGDAGSDQLFGTDGDDQLFGGTGTDVLYGEADMDELHGGADDDKLYGGPGNDTLNGDDGRDELHGEDGDDVLDGGDRNDKLYGDDGHDQLTGGLGSDTLYGGLGDDTLWGNAEKDRIFGDLGADIAYGGDGNDKIKGQDGNDQLFGESGDDKLFGGLDDDALNGGIGDDVLNGGGGHDRLEGDVGIDLIYGDAGNDWLSGGADDDTLYGGLDNDTLNGGDGRDLLHGEDGDDQIDGGAGNDKLFGDAGADDLVGGTGDDWLFAGEGNDALSGGDGKDRLFGHGGDDLLDGGGGNDKLKGLDGNDTLMAGLGDDILVGGLGTDVFVFDPSSGADTIKDFDPAFDTIRMTGVAESAVTLTASGADLLLDWGSASVLLVDVAEGAFDIAAIEFL